MARHVPDSPKLQRRGLVRRPTLEIVVVCEGKRTEPQYIAAFARDKANQLISIQVIQGAGVPLTVVRRASEVQQEKLKLAKRSRDSFELSFEVWALFDRDEHPGFAEACELAKSTGIRVASSNPCFEVWALVHFAEVNAPMHRHDAQSRLRDAMPSYHHEKNPLFDYDVLAPRYGDAVTHAIRGLKRRAEEAIPDGNPSTNAHTLFERIAEFGRGYHSGR